MIYYILFSLISILAIIGIAILLTRRASNKIKEYKEKEFIVERERYKRELEKEFERLKDVQYDELYRIKREIEEKKEFNSSIQKIREEELNRLIESQKKIKEDELNKLIEEKEKHAEALIDLEVEEWSRSAQEAANYESQLNIERLRKEREIKEEELLCLRREVDEFKEKRDAINQDILRARALEEKEDFYRVQLDEVSKRDIAVINSIKSSLSKIDLLDKLVYDIYVKKSVDEMIKRVLEGRAPCGIYKITRLKTKEIYIGKSTDIKARWQQHAKSAFHCGTISHSVLHTTMEKDGIDNFTWELLEEVPKDKLGERERYWIEWYDSKSYGLNEKIG